MAWPASFTLGWAATEYIWTWGEPSLHERAQARTPMRDDSDGGGGDGDVSGVGEHVDHGPGARAALWVVPPRRGGLRLQLHLPSLHLSATLLGFLCFAQRWRLVMLYALCTATWSGIGDSECTCF